MYGSDILQIELDIEAKAVALCFAYACFEIMMSRVQKQDLPFLFHELKAQFASTQQVLFTGKRCIEMCIYLYIYYIYTHTQC